MLGSGKYRISSLRQVVGIPGMLLRLKMDEWTKCTYKLANVHSVHLRVSGRTKMDISGTAYNLENVSSNSYPNKFVHVVDI